VTDLTDRQATPGTEPQLALVNNDATSSQLSAEPSIQPLRAVRQRGARRPAKARSTFDRSAESDRERRLFRRYQRDNDLDARRQLVERYMPLAHSLAHRYEGRGESAEDLLQVASLGLVKAIDRFDPERGFAFSSFGVPSILGELKRHFRDSGWTLHVPRDLQERALKTNAAAERLAGSLGQSPSPSQLARELDLPVEEVLEAIVAFGAYAAMPLDAPLQSSDAEGPTVADTLGEEDAGFELVDARVSIGPALQGLQERERMVLQLRFAEDLTQSEIAERIGVSQMHVSRLIRQALDRAGAVVSQAA
jgi:RNA polymerase sigma-B factor